MTSACDKAKNSRPRQTLKCIISKELWVFYFLPCSWTTFFTVPRQLFLLTLLLCENWDFWKLLWRSFEKNFKNAHHLKIRNRGKFIRRTKNSSRHMIRAFVEAATRKNPTAEWTSQYISPEVFLQIRSQPCGHHFSGYQVWVTVGYTTAPAYLGTLGFPVLAKLRPGQVLPSFAGRSFKGSFLCRVTAERH